MQFFYRDWNTILKNTNFFLFSFCNADFVFLCQKVLNVPDIRSRDHEVVVVRRTINLGTGNLEWGGNGEG
jgi:hypothetical protein